MAVGVSILAPNKVIIKMRCYIKVVCCCLAPAALTEGEQLQLHEKEDLKVSLVIAVSLCIYGCNQSWG